MTETSPSTTPKTHEFIFLLSNMFSMLAFAAALEPLRQANRMSRKPLYSWRLVSQTGEPVAASNGIVINVDGGLEDVPRDASIAVCTGFGLEQAASKPVLTWLRKQARQGVNIGALCTGSYVLAKAGLLHGKRCTIHWENQASFIEDFPEVELSNLLFCVDSGIFTCAGGTSATDMMLYLICNEHGPDLGSLIADTLVHSTLRTDTDEQRLSVPARIGVRHPKLVSIIQEMERSTEEPISPAELAKSVNMSTRQLERLFRRYLNRSPKRYYMELRLEKARNLLLQTDMSVINVALACGFTSPSHFSKCYRAHFNRTPYRERGSPTNTGAEKPPKAEAGGA
jgi:transcriptional regulator GlxA family with amidase domain